MKMMMQQQQQQRTYMWLLLLVNPLIWVVVNGAPPSVAPPSASAMRLDFCSEKSKHLSKFFTINDLICWNTNNLNYYEYFRMFNITNGHLSNEYQVSKLFGRFDDFQMNIEQAKSNEIEGGGGGGGGRADYDEEEELKILWAFTFDVIQQNCLRVKPQPLMHYCKRIQQLANTIIVRLSNMEMFFMQLQNGHFIRQPEDGGQYFLEFRALIKHLDRFMPISSITFDETRDLYISTHYGQFNQICVTRALWYGKVLVNNQTRLLAVKVPLPELSQLLQRDLFDTRCVFTKQHYSSVIDYKQMIYGTRARRDSATGRVDHLQLMFGETIEFKWLNTETDQAFFDCYGNSSIVKLRTSTGIQVPRQFWPSILMRQNGPRKTKGLRMFRNMDDDDEGGGGKDSRYYSNQRYFWFHVVLWGFIAIIVLMLLLNFCSLRKSRLNIWNWAQSSMGKPPIGRRKIRSTSKKPPTSKRGGGKRGGGKDSKGRKSRSRKKSKSGRSGRKPSSGGGPAKKSKSGKLQPPPKHDRSKGAGGGSRKKSKGFKRIGNKLQWFLQDRMIGLGFGGDDDDGDQRRPGRLRNNIQQALKNKKMITTTKKKKKAVSSNSDLDSTMEDGFTTFERSDRQTTSPTSGSDSSSGSVPSYVSQSKSTIGLSPGDSGFVDYDNWIISSEPPPPSLDSPPLNRKKPSRKIRATDSLVLMMRKKLNQERLQSVKQENKIKDYLTTSTSFLLDDSDKSSMNHSDCILKQMEDEKKRVEPKLSLTNQMAGEEHGHKLERIINMMRQMNEQMSLSPGGQQPSSNAKPTSTDQGFEKEEPKEKSITIEEVEEDFMTMDDDDDDLETTTDQGGHHTSSWHSTKPPPNKSTTTTTNSALSSTVQATIDIGSVVSSVEGVRGGGAEAGVLSFPYRPTL